MVLQYVGDVLLQKVAECFRELVICIQYTMQSTTPSSLSRSDDCPCRFMVLERLLLLHHRSQDVLADFSGYYCLRLLLDQGSPLATYFIDLFHQLEWLLEALIVQSAQYREMGDFGWEKLDTTSLPEDLYHKTMELLNCIRPAVSTCRYLFIVSEITILAKRAFYGDRSSESEELPNISKQFDKSKICRRLGKILRKGKDRIHMERQANAHRELPMDRFDARLQRLPFVNLDRCSRENRVELRKKLGEGTYAVVYEGDFVNFNPSNQSQQTVGQPVAVKVFRSGEIISRSGTCESEVGSKFFSQMEAMLQHKESAASKPTESILTTEEAFSEELWKLVTAKHPNVISARGYISRRPQGESGLVMELMSTSLQEFLEKVAEPLQELQMVDLMLEIAKGMRFLHECGLAHRDLKPHNILLRFREQLVISGKHAYPGAVEVKLADFGLAQRIVTKRVDAQVSGIDYCGPAGTHCYMAPELLGLAEFRTSDKVDVFSFGTTCFNILTCEDADALHFTYARSKSDARRFYDAVRSNGWRDQWVKSKPEYLIDLISRCWAFDACQRPTFAAICCLLQRAILCILAPPVISEQVLMGIAPANNLTARLLSALLIRSSLRYSVAGIDMIESRVREFHSMLEDNAVSDKFLRKLDFLDEIKESATTFLEQRIIKGSGMMDITRRYTLQAVMILRGSATRGPSAAPCKEAKSKSASKVELQANSADQNRASSSNIDTSKAVNTSKAVIWQLKQQGRRQEPSSEEAPQYLHIPLTTMNPEWNVFKALVCCSILSHFPYNFLISDIDLRKETYSIPISTDDAKTDLNVDDSLMPFLECFWESSGFIQPSFHFQG